MRAFAILFSVMGLFAVILGCTTILVPLAVAVAQSTPTQTVAASPSPAAVALGSESGADAQATLEASSEATGQIATPTAKPDQVVVDKNGDPTAVLFDPTTRLRDFWGTQVSLVPLVLMAVALLKRHVPFVTSNPLIVLGSSFLAGVALSLLGKAIGYLTLDWEGAVTFGLGTAVLASGGRAGLVALLAKIFDIRELSKVKNGTVPNFGYGDLITGEQETIGEPVQTVQRHPDPDQQAKGVRDGRRAQSSRAIRPPSR